MGVNGCGWILMDALIHVGHGEHKNKAMRVHKGSRSSGFGTYGRGNFPGHDVLWVLPKMVKNGCRWVMMDNNG